MTGFVHCEKFLLPGVCVGASPFGKAWSDGLTTEVSTDFKKQ